MTHVQLRVLVTRTWGVGGGQNWLHEFANRLAGLGHQVQVVFLRTWWPGMRHPRDGGPDKLGETNYRPVFLDVPLFLESWWLASFLRKHLQHHVADIIVSTGAEAAWVHWIQRGGRPPHVASFHHTYPDWVGLRGLISRSLNLTRGGIVRTYFRWAQSRDLLSMSRSDMVVCSSAYQADRAVKVLGVPSSKVRVIYYGLDTRFFLLPPQGRTSREREILYAGGAFASKGLDLLLEAFARLAPKFAGVRLSVVGGGDWGPYREKVKALGLDGYVRYHGAVPKDHIKTIYQNASLFVAPTRHESFGLILAEAMACGVPVVATRITAIPEIVEDGVTGLLVPADDPVALAGALEVLLSDRHRATAMGMAGRARVERLFSWDTIMPQWERLLLQVALGA